MEPHAGKVLNEAQKSLLRRLRHSLEARGLREKGRLSLPDLPPHEAGALADLLGLSVTPRPPFTLQLERVDAALRNSRLQCGLLEILILLDGPLRDTRVERAARRDAEAAFWQSVGERPEIIRRPQLRAWALRLQKGGLKRATQGMDSAQALESALAIINQLPSHGIRLQVLAADVLGDPHALDLGTSTCSLVTSALASLAERPLPISAADRRSLWMWAGVSLDDLSSDVLVFGLVTGGKSLVSSTLNAFAADGQPYRLTMRQIAKADLDFARLDRVFICENPTVVGVAAERLASKSAPLVCTEGMLSGAAEALFRRMQSHRIKMTFHGDFDWGGIRIGNVLLQRFGAKPWSYDATHYVQALDRIKHRAELAGARVQATWDPDLSRVMSDAQWAVYEEQLMEDLLRDLAT